MAAEVEGCPTGGDENAVAALKAMAKFFLKGYGLWARGQVTRGEHSLASLQFL
jgi:hypothetical protein